MAHVVLENLVKTYPEKSGPGATVVHGINLLEMFLALGLQDMLVGYGGLRDISRLPTAMQPLLAGDRSERPPEVFVQISESQTGRAVRTQRWKYSVRAPGKYNHKTGAAAGLYEEDFLYDLDADPHERTNLVREPALAGVREEMKARLLRRMAQAHEALPSIVPAAAEAQEGTEAP